MFDNAPAWARKRADFAIDLGTANTLVVHRSEGVVFEQPSVCCFDGDVDGQQQLFAAGTDAKQAIGREVRSLRTVRPLRNGVLVDVAATRELLRFAVSAVTARRQLRRPRPVVGVPTDATQAERRALTKAVWDAGLAEPLLMPEPMLAAMGSGLDVDAPRGRMVIDCGAGTTDVMVLSLGGICVSRSVRGGGDAVDAALLQHLHLKHHFHVGQSTAERLKMALSGALISASTDELEVKGLDMTTGLPKAISLRVEELRPIIEKYAAEVSAAVRATFAETEPDLASHILEDGIALTGGAAMTALLAERIGEATGIRARCAGLPDRAVAKGLEIVLDKGAAAG